jgi:cell division transport system ATP-binding protein
MRAHWQAREREGPVLTPIVEFDSVGLRYGTGAEVLRDLDFRLSKGGFYFLTGPSGAGKTSLLKLLYLAQRPTRGRISLFGEDLTGAARDAMPQYRRRIGVVFQDFRLIRHLSAFDNVALPLRISGASEEEVEGPVREMLAWVGLADRASARPPTLSGGEQQRVAIARAVINRPELLVADEPTGNVDADMAKRLLHLFTSLNRLGTTVVVATHDVGLISATPGAQMIRLETGSYRTRREASGTRRDVSRELRPDVRLAVHVPIRAAAPRNPSAQGSDPLGHRDHDVRDHDCRGLRGSRSPIRPPASPLAPKRVFRSRFRMANATSARSCKSSGARPA